MTLSLEFLHTRLARVEEALLPAHVVEAIKADPDYPAPPADLSAAGDTPDSAPSDTPAVEAAPPTTEMAQGPSSSY